MKNYMLEVFNGASYILASIQSNEVYQTIEFILAILTSVVLLAFRIWKWYLEAKKDGKIDKDEVEDLIHIVGDGVDEIKDKTNKKED